MHEIGDWRPGQVKVSWGESTRLIVPEVEREIERAWNEVRQRPGVRLFDGPMCRMESGSATPTSAQLVLSRTSYRIFVGTNLFNPQRAETYGRRILASPVGVSPALLTSDGFLLMGRRNASVAYYPHRVHPFAGALEPRDALDLFVAVARELAEELSFTQSDIAEIRLTGIVEDIALWQPELIFFVRSTRTRAQIESQVDAAEHHASWAIPSTASAVSEAIADPALTPVAVASLLLWGRLHFGDAWFESTAPGIWQRGQW